MAGDAALAHSPVPLRVDVGRGARVRRVAVAADAVCAMLMRAPGKSPVKCWGRGGVLGTGSLAGVGLAETPGDIPVIDLGPLSWNATFLDLLAVGKDPGKTAWCVSFTESVIPDVRAKCWGVSGNGLLMNAPAGNSGIVGDEPHEMGVGLADVDFGVTGVSGFSGMTTGGGSHACVAHQETADLGYVIKCWGLNSHGQLTTGGTETFGDDTRERGDALALGFGGQRVAVVATGGSSTCVVPFVAASGGGADLNSVTCYGGLSSGSTTGAVSTIGNSGALRTLSSPLHACPYDPLYSDAASVFAEPICSRLTKARTIGPGGWQRRSSLAMGVEHMCAILRTDVFSAHTDAAGGQVACWGTVSAVGKLGDARANGLVGEGNLQWVWMGVDETATEIKSGGHYTCALLSGTAQLKCWGNNVHGQLGLESSAYTVGVAPRDPVDLGRGLHVVQYSTADTHVCVILNNGYVKCWGSNSNSQLGLGQRGVANLGRGTGEMGDYLPYVNMGPHRTALRIVCGASHTCVLANDFQVYCWGQAQVLGHGDTDPGNGAWGDDAEEMGIGLVPIDTTNFEIDDFPVGLATSGDYTCTWTTTGNVYCWGVDSSGNAHPVPAAPGISPDLQGPIYFMSGGGGTMCATSTTRVTVCWGDNGDGQASPSAQTDTITAAQCETLDFDTDTAAGEQAVFVAAAGALGTGRGGKVCAIVHGLDRSWGEAGGRSGVRCYGAYELGNTQTVTPGVPGGTAGVDLWIHGVYRHRRTCVPCGTIYRRPGTHDPCPSVGEWRRIECADSSTSCSPCPSGAVCDGTLNIGCLAVDEMWHPDLEACLPIPVSGPPRTHPVQTTASPPPPPGSTQPPRTTASPPPPPGSTQPPQTTASPPPPPGSTPLGPPGSTPPGPPGSTPPGSTPPGSTQPPRTHPPPRTATTTTTTPTTTTANGDRTTARAPSSQAPATAGPITTPSPPTPCACRYHGTTSPNCVICPANSYCPCDGQYSDGTGPVGCPTRATSYEGSAVPEDCTCVLGEYFDSVWGYCRPCPDGSEGSAPGSCVCAAGYSIAAGDPRPSTPCTPCARGFICPGGASQPLACGSEQSTPHTGSYDDADCECNRGFHSPGAVAGRVDCASCPAGRVCHGGLSAPLECPPHSTFTASAVGLLSEGCACNAGYAYEAADAAGCDLCPLGSYCVGGAGLAEECAGQNSTASTGSAGENDCACLNGRYWDGSLCTICELGYYCLGGVREQCPAYKTTTLPGANRIEACECEPGAPLSCAEGTVVGTTPAPAPECGGIGEELTGAGPLTWECGCASGWTRKGGACATCTAGYYCRTTNATEQPCPVGTSSSPGSSSASDCFESGTLTVALTFHGNVDNATERIVFEKAAKTVASQTTGVPVGSISARWKPISTSASRRRLTAEPAMELELAIPLHVTSEAELRDIMRDLADAFAVAEVGAQMRTVFSSGSLNVTGSVVNLTPSATTPAPHEEKSQSMALILIASCSVVGAGVLIALLVLVLRWRRQGKKKKPKALLAQPPAVVPIKRMKDKDSDDEASDSDDEYSDGESGGTSMESSESSESGESGESGESSESSESDADEVQKAITGKLVRGSAAGEAARMQALRDATEARIKETMKQDALDENERKRKKEEEEQIEEPPSTDGEADEEEERIEEPPSTDGEADEEEERIEEPPSTDGEADEEEEQGGDSASTEEDGGGGEQEQEKEQESKKEKEKETELEKEQEQKRGKKTQSRKAQRKEEKLDEEEGGAKEAVALKTIRVDLNEEDESRERKRTGSTSCKPSICVLKPETPTNRRVRFYTSCRM